MYDDHVVWCTRGEDSVLATSFVRLLVQGQSLKGEEVYTIKFSRNRIRILLLLNNGIPQMCYELVHLLNKTAEKDQVNVINHSLASEICKSLFTNCYRITERRIQFCF